MQKFRFLLPLLVLTVVVVVISFTVSSYKSRSDEKEYSVSGETVSVYENTTQPSDNGSTVVEEKQGILSRIVGIIKPKPTKVPVTPSPSLLDTEFDSQQVEVGTDEEKVITVLLPTNTKRPTAYTFDIKYDSKAVTLIKLEPGDTWDKTSILKRAINPSSGTATISAGQALGSQNSSQGETLIKIYVRAKSTVSVQSLLEIEGSSEFAYVGLDYSIPLKSQSIQVIVQ